MMNCIEISRLLDECEMSALSAAEMAAVEVHVSTCADCAEQCIASASLESFRSDVPPLPASLRERARQLHEACESAAGQRRTRRPVIIGSLLLLGAAATMFTAVPWHDANATNQ